ncbi:unnamed protein product [Dibothriocephalus latus]|uniref:Uncharacterized protein n=1 Tax=Dibothriocephalus latus TaxID=60516 RepID=A0A3P7LHK4_DIBLA|nr:unnamed protein product [Dibothriocephalus latus]
MNEADYEAKVNNLLMDKEAYMPSTDNELKKLVNSINKTVDTLRNARALTRREALATKVTNAAMPRFYGLPQIHNAGMPLDPSSHYVAPQPLGGQIGCTSDFLCSPKIRRVQ